MYSLDLSLFLFITPLLSRASSSKRPVCKWQMTCCRLFMASPRASLTRSKVLAQRAAWPVRSPTKYLYSDMTKTSGNLTYGTLLILFTFNFLHCKFISKKGDFRTNQQHGLKAGRYCCKRSKNTIDTIMCRLNQKMFVLSCSTTCAL